VGIETTTFSGSAENNTILNNTANNNTYSGIDVYLADNNVIQDNIADYNGWDTKTYYPTGISLFQASGNSVINNTARHNRYRDFSTFSDTNARCNNLVQNMIVSEGREYLYYNSSVSLSNQVIGGLILCNADNSNITNVTIKGSSQIRNNGISMSLTSGAILDGINSSYNAEWVLDSESDNNIITNSFIEYNDYVGISLSLCASGNNITNSQINNNTKDGIVVASQCTSGNLFDNNSISFNGEEGCDFYKGSSQKITNNQINNNTNNGIKLDSQSSSNTLENNTIQNNGINGLLISGASNNNLIRDTLISGSIQNDTKITSSTNNRFINVSYNISKEYVDTSSTLLREWYLNVRTVNQGEGGVDSANVSIYNSTMDLVNNSLTDTNGYTGNLNFLSYINNGTDRYYYSNYTINGTKTGCTGNQSEVNLTSNLAYSLLLVDNGNPNVTLISPTNGASYSGSSYSVLFEFNVSDSESGIKNCSIMVGSSSYQNTSAISEDSENNISVSLSSGSYNTYVSCYDSAGNLGNSSTVSLTITAPSSENNNGGGGGLPTYYPTETDLKEGYSKSMGRNWKIKFKSNNENHELKVNEIQNNSVTITVLSNPITFNLFINETKKVDINNDSYYDLSVFLEEIKYSRATLVIKELNESIFPVIKEEEAIQNNSEINDSNVNEDLNESIFPVIKEEEAIQNNSEINDSNVNEDLNSEKNQDNKFIYSLVGIILIAIVITILTLKSKPKKKRK
jgi:parallel beta-helix repeat protein